MSERTSGEGSRTSGWREPEDIEQQLAAYYGPPLPEEPLPPEAWQRLRVRLASHPLSHRRSSVSLGRVRRSRPAHISALPVQVEAACERVASSAQLPFPSTSGLVRCHLRARGAAPALRVCLTGQVKIRLFLPASIYRTLTEAAFDMLIASGLARYRCMRRAGYLLIRALLLLGIWPLWLLPIVFWQQPLLRSMTVVVALCAMLLGGWLLQRQRRALVFRADRLAVAWLGRPRVCQGLHALSGYRQPARWRAWGEPALAERIERVCGSEVDAEERRLTLVG
jgi:hypothetical protein